MEKEKKLDILYHLAHGTVDSKPRTGTCSGCFNEKICWKDKKNCTTYYYISTDGVTKEQFLKNIEPDKKTEGEKNENE